MLSFGKKIAKKLFDVRCVLISLFFQMYGEKVEEAEELRLDLSDVKEMYKVQIQDLLKSAVQK